MITNTWVLNYLSGAERTAYLAALDELGRERDVSWVFAESPVLVPELPVADRRRPRPRSSSSAGAAAGAPSTTSATPTPTATGSTGT